MKRRDLMENGFSPGKCLVQTALALLTTLTFSISAAFGANTVALPDYANPLLTPGSQGYGLTGFVWNNIIPNALADYFTFRPYSTADAVALGFPSTCGAVGPAGEDCYTITAKSFTQPLSLYFLGAPFASSPVTGANSYGLKDATGVPVFPATSAAGTPFTGPAGANLAGGTHVYGYGSGGNGWRPWYIEPGTTAATNQSLTVTGNAPAFFAATNFGAIFPSPDFPFASDTGIWHYPGPTIKATKGRPVRIQWVNQLTNREYPGFDPTVDCTDAAPNCFPYNRIVTHVHGGHVGPESDGLTQAYYNPDFTNVGLLYNSFNNPTPAVDVYGKYHVGPKGTYYYPMDQEAGTIWYHDHAAGSTHTTTNMGLAGFFPITDDNEKCLQGIRTGCTKILPTGTVVGGVETGDSAYELGFALQDRVFYASNGQLAMPDAKIIDGRFPTCDPLTPASRLATCSPLFMYANHAANAASLTPAGTHLVPYDEGTLDTTIPANATAPVLASSATLEFFGNMPVVNGVVYGKYDVEPRVYRMRLLNGADSRTWVLQLQAYNNLGASLGFVNFYQIGTEQGFLNAPALLPQILLMPGERIDVLVDFSTLPAGTTRVVMNNLGPDAPYQGQPIVPTDRSADIPEIMVFDLRTLGATPNTPLPGTITNLRPIGGNIAPITAPSVNNYRKIALEEIVDEYQRIQPTIDRRGYNLPGIPSTEIIKVNDIEEWDIINTTADAHPMHLHQVAFQVISRTPFAPNTFVPAVNDPVNNVFTEPSYTATGPAVPPDPQDSGWKDTVFTPPGFVTKVRAKFDLVGEYVWHCHILSHEEHDMMRPMNIVATSAAPPAGPLVLPATSTNVRTAAVSVGLSPTANVKYIYEFKLATDLEWTTNPTSTQAATLTFPKDGVYSVRVKVADAKVPMQGVVPYASITFAPSTYVNAANTITVGPADSITPSSGTFAGNSQVFTISPMVAPVTARTLLVGTTPDGSDLGRYTVNAATSVNVVNLPTNGLPVYVTLWVKVVTVVNGSNVTEMRKNSYVFTATNHAGMISPAYGATLAGPSQTFTWTNTGASSYQLWVGTTVGGSNIATSVASAATSATISGLPTNGTPVYVRLWSVVGGTWVFNDYSYTATNSAAMISPVNATTLAGPSVTFTWNNAGATSYQVWVGTTVGGSEIATSAASAATSATISGLPTNGSPVKVRLWSQFGSTLVFNDYSYTATNSAVISSPANLATFTGTSQTFTWNNTGATSYQIWVGTTVGGSEIATSVASAATSATISGLPANGSPVKVRLWSQFGATWVFNDYSYTSTGAATMISPANASTLPGPSLTFTWNNTGATSYQIWVGTTVGGSEIATSVASAATSATISGLPTNGSPVKVRLWSQFGGTLVFNDYSYTATNAAVISSPVNATTLAGTRQTFYWNNTGATAYQLWIGTTVGGSEISTSTPSTATSVSMTGLPFNGTPVKVRLWSLFGNAWAFNDYSYTSTGPATMITPVNLATLVGPSQTFTWNNTGADSYQIWVGTTLGSSNISTSVPSTATTATVTVPANGTVINVRLWSKFNATWTSNDYSYTSNP